MTRKAARRRAVKGQGLRPVRWRDRWRAYLTTGYDRQGRPIREWVYGRTADECQEKLDALKRQKAEGGLSGDGSPPALGAWLEHWLRKQAERVKPRTVALYGQDIQHIPAKLKSRRIDRITPLQVEAALSLIAEEVSPRAANQARKRLSSALRAAQRFGFIARNPVEAVESVSYTAKAPRVWTASEVLRFVEVTRGGRCWYFPLFYAALTTGARVGELFALRWGDYDGETLMIERTASGHGKDRTIGPPKTKAGRRRVPVSPDLAAVLEAHRAALALAGLPTGPADTLFPSEAGTLVTYSNARRALHHWAAKAKVPELRLHDLRHTFASMAIAQGMSPADLARQLGHKDASFTLRQYVHFFERARPRPALSLAELTGSEEGSVEVIGGKVGGNRAREPS
ncbi:MAG TPA: tyrosine-type recombinase/integrase [Longimicrobiales bacterium]